MRLARLFAATGLSLCAVGAARAQTPGSQDTTFAAGPPVDRAIRALALQPNGQVLVGGLFTGFGGQPRNCVARLNPDGTLDSFDPGSVLSGYTNPQYAVVGYNDGYPKVYSIAVQADGKVIVAGIFSVLDQAPGGGLARFNSDGSLDSTFNVGTGIVEGNFEVGQANCVAVLPNGQILVGGRFQVFDGFPFSGLVRLNADGSVDTTFNSGGAGFTRNGYDISVTALAVQSNGQIVIGGNFATYNGVAESCVARLNADGTLDESFNVEFGPDLNVYAVAVQSNGQVIVGGNFNSFGNANVPYTHLVRLNTDGSVDSAYVESNFRVFISEVDAIVLQPDDEAIIGGAFTSEYDGQVETAHNGVARILTSGMQDTSFDSGDGSDAGQALALVLQPDGKVIEASEASDGSGYTSNVFRLYAPISPAVSIATGVAETSENSGAPATFVLTLSSAQSVDLEVSYAVKGTGQNGVDYAYLKGSAKIKAGKTAKTIPVTPIDRGISGGGKATVKLTLTAGSGYLIGSPDVAKVKIIDDD